MTDETVHTRMLYGKQQLSWAASAPLRICSLCLTLITSSHFLCVVLSLCLSIFFRSTFALLQSVTEPSTKANSSHWPRTLCKPRRFTEAHVLHCTDPVSSFMTSHGLDFCHASNCLPSRQTFGYVAVVAPPTEDCSCSEQPAIMLVLSLLSTSAACVNMCGKQCIIL